MSVFLNLIYLVTLILISPWIAWRAAFKGKNRRGWTQKLLGWVPPRLTANRCIWLHAVSVGEVKLLGQLIRSLQSEFPDSEFVITTSTETGFDFARQKYTRHTVLFCPFDFSWAVNSFLRRIRPDLLLIAEVEIWPNLIRCTRGQGIPVGVVNARLGERSFRGYRFWSPLISRVFRQVSLVAAQTSEYAQRFIALGCDPQRVVVTGSVKYDGLLLDRDNPQTAHLSRLREDDGGFLFVAGSTQWEENLLCLDVYQQLRGEYPELRLVLVPRHLDRVGDLVEEVTGRGLACQLRSQCSAERSIRLKNGSILVVDVIGELSAWWGLAEAAFVGGSFGSRGGQNMLEPAGFGVPTCFGPNTWNFRDDVQRLLAGRAAVVVRGADELRCFLKNCITDPELVRAMGRRATHLVVAQQGASDRTARAFRQILSEPTRSTNGGSTRAA